MMTTVRTPVDTPSLSISARRVLSYLHGEQVRWVVLHHARVYAAAGLDEPQFRAAIEELEAAELVERAPYGPLLYIR